jgi:hypothetical protein
VACAAAGGGGVQPGGGAGCRPNSEPAASANAAAHRAAASGGTAVRRRAPARASSTRSSCLDSSTGRPGRPSPARSVSSSCALCCTGPEPPIPVNGVPAGVPRPRRRAGRVLRRADRRCGRATVPAHRADRLEGRRERRAGPPLPSPTSRTRPPLVESRVGGRGGVSRGPVRPIQPHAGRRGRWACLRHRFVEVLSAGPGRVGLCRTGGRPGAGPVRWLGGSTTAQTGTPCSPADGAPRQPAVRRAATSCVSWGATANRSPTTP